MAFEISTESINDEPVAQKSQAELDAFLAHIDVLRAENEEKGKDLIRTWMTPETREKYDKLEKRTKEELDAEDARLFRPQPLFLGVGADVPADFLATEGQVGNKALRAKFFPATSLKASKARDAEEKAASAKRGLRAESSDEEEGRSALGKAKKRKTARAAQQNGVTDAATTSTGVPSQTVETSTGALLQVSEPQPGPIEDPTPEASPPDLLEDPLKNGEKQKKKRKKSKNKNSGEPTKAVLQATNRIKEVPASVEHDILTTASQTVSPLDDSKPKGEAVAPDVLSAFTSLATSKEQRQKDKKARKEERRRLKALEVNL